MFYYDQHSSALGEYYIVIMPVQHAISVLNEDADDTEEFISGFSDLEYLYNYDEMYSDTLRLARTWKHGKPIHQYRQDTKLSQLYWDVHRTFTQFTISTHTAIEFLTTNLLASSMEPDEKELAIESVEQLNQHRREQILTKEDIISGKISERLSQFRGKRNTFAHEWGTQFELGEHTEPIEHVQEGRELVEILVEQVYNNSLSEIISFIEGCYGEPESENIRDWTTFQVMRRYIQEYSWFYQIDGNIPGTKDERNIKNLEIVLQDRGFKPERVRERGLYTQRGVSRKGHVPASQRVVTRYEEEIPQTVTQNQEEIFEIEFDVRDKIQLPADDRIQQLELYSILLMDDLVVDKAPEKESRTVETGETVRMSMSHQFETFGEVEAKIGVVFTTKNNYSTLIINNKITIVKEDLTEKGN